MSFPLFLRGMLVALTAFAITTYVVTQSVWTTFVWTLACAVLIQVGYFVTVLILIWGSSRDRHGDKDASESQQIQSAGTSGKQAGDAGQVPGIRRSSQL
jgi:exopolysaccharide production repressor protein